MLVSAVKLCKIFFNKHNSHFDRVQNTCNSQIFKHLLYVIFIIHVNIKITVLIKTNTNCNLSHCISDR